jgi:hypothetical protein
MMSVCLVVCIVQAILNLLLINKHACVVLADVHAVHRQGGACAQAGLD